MYELFKDHEKIETPLSAALDVGLGYLLLHQPGHTMSGGEAQRLRTTAGKDPMGLAAAALYIACVMCDEKRTQKMIADAAGVTEVTIRNRYKGLKEALGLEI